MIHHVRQECKAQMLKMKDDALWEGVDFKTLAVVMSSENETFPMYVERMGVDRCWLDAYALHALGCRYCVDVMIWQEIVDPSIVGHSFAGRKDEPLAVISVAMVNYFHFWGVIHAEEPVPTLVLGADLPERPPTFKKDNSDSDDDKQHGMAAPRKRRNDQSVEAELAVCQQLAVRNPWGAPSADLIAALQGHKGLAPTEESVCQQCGARQYALEQLMYERTHEDAMPDRLKCNAATRWRLGMGLVRRNQSKKELIADDAETSETLSMAAISDRLRERCSQNKRPHHCLDAFRENADSVRVWRTL